MPWLASPLRVSRWSRLWLRISDNRACWLFGLSLSGASWSQASPRGDRGGKPLFSIFDSTNQGISVPGKRGKEMDVFAPEESSSTTEPKFCSTNHRHFFGRGNGSPFPSFVVPRADLRQSNPEEESSAIRPEESDVFRKFFFCCAAIKSSARRSAFSSSSSFSIAHRAASRRRRSENHRSSSSAGSQDANHPVSPSSSNTSNKTAQQILVEGMHHTQSEWH
eukprot:CAMPEP_0183733658 /NCGR_PEP_ID=MMETSP0737-20130205/41655_1 /TAXON_ID=385413 /ORGANISM="Thalassiosira miniscula, Strain CCMP1093" /LENGTH=220 /DNA_ID=CAMNT_0025966949 /DNA_START=377 /DNA_END=1037 /DNA_ORIENTATION=+